MNEERAMVEERKYRYVFNRCARLVLGGEEALKNEIETYFWCVDTRMKDLSCMKPGYVLYTRSDSEMNNSPMNSFYGAYEGYSNLLFSRVELISVVDEELGIVKVKTTSSVVGCPVILEECGDVTVDYLWVESTKLNLFKTRGIEELQAKGYLNSKNVPISLYYSDVTGIGYIEKDLKIPNFKFQIYYDKEKGICQVAIDIEEEYYEIAKRELKEVVPKMWGVRLKRAIIKRAQNIGDIALIRTLFYQDRFERYKNAEFFLQKGISVPEDCFAYNPVVLFLFEYYVEKGLTDYRTLGEFDVVRSNIIAEYTWLKKNGIIFEKDLAPLYPKALLDKGFEKDYYIVKHFSKP